MKKANRMFSISYNILKYVLKKHIRFFGDKQIVGSECYVLNWSGFQLSACTAFAYKKKMQISIKMDNIERNLSFVCHYPIVIIY